MGREGTDEVSLSALFGVCSRTKQIDVNAHQ